MFSAYRRAIRGDLGAFGGRLKSLSVPLITWLRWDSPSVNLSIAIPCLRCSSVFNCGSCGEAGCDSCSAESYLTNSLVYPGRKECARCQGCRSCSAKAGCDCESQTTECEAQVLACRWSGYSGCLWSFLQRQPQPVYVLSVEVGRPEAVIVAPIPSPLCVWQPTVRQWRRCHTCV